MIETITADNSKPLLRQGDVQANDDILENMINSLVVDEPMAENRPDTQVSSPLLSEEDTTTPARLERASDQGQRQRDPGSSSGTMGCSSKKESRTDPLGFCSEHQRGQRTLRRPTTRGEVRSRNPKDLGGTSKEGGVVGNQQGNSFQRSLPARSSSFKGISRPTVPRRTLPSRGRSFNAKSLNAKSEKVAPPEAAKIMYMGRELDAAKTFADARARSKSPGHFRRTSIGHKEREVAVVNQQPEKSFQRSLPGRSSSFKGPSRPAAVPRRKLPSRGSSFKGFEAAAKAMNLPTPRTNSRLQLVRAASARTANSAGFQEGFQKFEFNKKDVEDIANDPEYFRKLKTRLKEKGVVTNEVLKQQLCFYTKHHKDLVQKRGRSPKSENDV